MTQFKVTIISIYSYGAIDIKFKRQIELPFVPFYGLTIWSDEEGNYLNSIELDNNDYKKCRIYYNLETNGFLVELRENLKNRSHWWIAQLPSKYEGYEIKTTRGSFEKVLEYVKPQSND